MRNALTSTKQWLEDVRSSTKLDVYRRTRTILRDTKQYAFREVNIRSYLARSKVRKLQVGTGTNHLLGWLNTDIEPTDRRIAYMNATKRFPFEDTTFDAIFSEHMIEHVSYEGGRSMLQECFRVLKPGGEIRIVTPDIKALLALYDVPRSETQDLYIRWMTDQFWPSLKLYEPVFVINLAMRFSGHQFFYDGSTLEKLLKDSGFDGIKRVQPGKSQRAIFENVDSHADFIQFDAINQYEAMAFEAVKPAR